MKRRRAKADGATIASISSEAVGGDRRYTVTLSHLTGTSNTVKLTFRYHSNGNAPQFSIGPTGAFAGGSGELWYPQSAYEERDTGSLCFSIPSGWSIVATGNPVSSTTATEHCFRPDHSVKFAFSSAPYVVTPWPWLTKSAR